MYVSYFIVYIIYDRHYIKLLLTMFWKNILTQGYIHMYVIIDASIIIQDGILTKYLHLKK